MSTHQQTRVELINLPKGLKNGIKIREDIKELLNKPDPVWEMTRYCIILRNQSFKAAIDKS